MEAKRRRIDELSSLPQTPGAAPFDVRSWLRSCQDPGKLEVGERVACFRKTADSFEIRRPDEARPPLIRNPPIGADLNVDLASTKEKVAAKRAAKAALPDPAADCPVDPVVEAVGDRRGDVVTFRNNLNKIGFTPYNTQDPWQLDAVVVDGTLFLDIRDPYPDNCPPLLQHYGRRLEALVTGKTEEDEFCSVTSVRIGALHLHVAAEIDAEAEDGSFVEVKCAITPERANQWRTYNNVKLCKFWLQSALVSVPWVLVCFRSQNGRVEDSAWLRTAEIPGQAQWDGARWQDGQILKFLEDVLGWLKKACEKGGQLRATFDPKAQSISAEPVEGDLADRVHAAAVG